MKTGVNGVDGERRNSPEEITEFFTTEIAERTEVIHVAVYQDLSGTADNV